MDESFRLKPAIALTGATGFIGRELQRQLAAAGYPLRALVRPGSRHRGALLETTLNIAIALDDEPALTAALDGAELVVYCAGAVRGATASDFAPANIEGLRHLCRAAASQPTPPHILLISSLAATRPHLSDYARSKFEGEQVLRATTLGWTILRPPAVYGPGDREMLPLFRAIRAGLALIVGPRTQRLSLLHVEDLGRAVLACIAHRDACTGMVFEPDDEYAQGYGWADIVACARGAMPVVQLHVPRRLLALMAHLNLALSRLFRHAPMLTPGKVRELSEPSWLCDNSRLRAVTGWVPQVQLRTGIGRLFGS